MLVIPHRNIWPRSYAYHVHTYYCKRCYVILLDPTEIVENVQMTSIHAIKYTENLHILLKT